MRGAERSCQRRRPSSNACSLEEFGLSESELFHELADLIERFDFHPEDAPTDATGEPLQGGSQPPPRRLSGLEFRHFPALCEAS